MIITFDIGGTTTRIGTSADAETIAEITTYPTPQTYQDGVNQFVDHVHTLTGNQPVESVVGGLAGLLNQEKTQLVRGGNISDWVGKPFAVDVANQLSTDVILENDTALAALGEANYGAGKEHSNLLYLSIGTGVGGAWIINKSIPQHGFGFEPGHQIIDYTNSKSLQDLISGKSLSIEFGIPTNEISSEEVWQSIADPLFVGLHNTLMHWPAEIIILGGGVILGHDLPLEELRDRLANKLPQYQPFPEISKAKLGDYPALYGALSLAKQKPFPV